MLSMRSDLIPWMMTSHVFDNMPVWWGWNSKVTNDILPKQIVMYMEKKIYHQPEPM